jgi:hypothetical protein
VEKFFIDKGHTVDRPTDYGTDILVNTFDEQGYAENGDIRIQLKASDGFKYAKDGLCISFEIDVRHYHLWRRELMPVFLILYDAKKTRAYWLYMQEHFATATARKPGKKAKSVTVRVPLRNELTAQTVDYMRERKAAILQQLEGEVRHDT